MTEPTIVVVGGGLSGALTALAMLRQGTGRVLVVEPRDPVGPGVAYGTDDPAHLLNSRAGTMSVDPDEPDGFVTWCRRNRCPRDPGPGDPPHRGGAITLPPKSPRSAQLP